MRGAAGCGSGGRLEDWLVGAAGDACRGRFFKRLRAGQGWCKLRSIFFAGR
ncbi:MAG: hypothetical protein C5S44_00595 [Candidatus Methanocomedens sp.]|nr:MAG: hypothetical protein C5S44_00595 [ANME-2 cluster archaeon]